MIARFVLLFLLAGSVAACDAVAPEPVTLPTKTVSFRFVFHSDTLGTGPFEVRSSSVVDLEGALDGFGKEEILEAEVVGLELERIEPPLVALDAIAEALAVRLTAPGEAERTIGEVRSPPSAPRVTVTPASVDVAALLRASAFGAVLHVDPQSLPSDRYELSAELRLRVVVEGL